jgi:DNA replication and repair protein RecF
MRLLRASFSDFRNLAGEELVPGPQLTVLYGPNGAGKTNVLEGLYLLSTLRSFKVPDLGALVRIGAVAGAVEVTIDDPVVGLASALAVRIQSGEHGTRRTAMRDGKLVRAAADFYGLFSVILFTPEDLEVLRGAPAGRRRFLDRMLFARDRAHIVDVQQYEKLLRSRNRVLRGGMDEPARAEHLLDVYDEGLAQVGARIWQRRAALVVALEPGFGRCFLEIHGPSVRATLGYRSRLGEGIAAGQHVDAIARGLRERRSRDCATGTTSVGPHRDDLDVTLDASPVASFASQGQARALVLALRIAELETARDPTGGVPLLLLDDVSSELDPERNEQLFGALARHAGQCILTTTAPGHVIAGRQMDRLDVEVRDGRLRARPA